MYYNYLANVTFTVKCKKLATSHDESKKGHANVNEGPSFEYMYINKYKKKKTVYMNKFFPIFITHKQIGMFFFIFFVKKVNLQ